MQLNLYQRRVALPLGLQLLAILVGSLMVAQLVTLALTLMLPPEPVQRWNLEEVANVLAGRDASKNLDTRRMAGPPNISGSGWLVSESSREALAQKLQRPTSEVVLAFYTQLPVGGVAVPIDRPKPALGIAEEQFSPLGWFITPAHAQGMPGGPPPGGMPGGGFPGGGFPGGGFPGGSAGGASTPGSGPASSPGSRGQAPAQSPSSSQNPQSLGSQGSANGQAAPPPGTPVGAPPVNLPPVITAPQVPDLPIARPVPQPTNEARPRTTTSAVRPETPTSITPANATAATPAPVAPLPSPQPGAPAAGNSAIPVPVGTPQAIPFRERNGLLSFASPPFIEGDFIAAVRQADGSWLAAAPKAEPFPNRWQRRVMLWFVLSLLIVAPFALLFARRIVNPLKRFAQTAELLGRDPAASVLPLSGPAEIGRAARAFNVMHTRLRAFVDDRTAMVGAISHDLRTPLTRLRFRIEDVPDDQRDGLLREVEEMEEMINQVINFIKDASSPGARERVDFAELVLNSVEDAKVLGGKVDLEVVEHGLVEVDPLGMRRLLGNLLENALKYGEHARVRVALRDDQAIAEIIDDGPGIPADEYEQAFEPFYRGVQARDSDKPGSGLGLAVCRSIARAHGGEVHLEKRSEGFVASVAVPLSFDDRIPQAA